jgi:hypothetical protein
MSLSTCLKPLRGVAVRDLCIHRPKVDSHVPHRILITSASISEQFKDRWEREWDCLYITSRSLDVI